MNTEKQQSTSTAQFDLQVEISTNLFGKSKFAWQQAHFNGQQLQIRDGQQVLLNLSTSQCKLQEHKPAKNTFALVEGGQRKLIIHFPSQTVRSRFELVLRESSRSPTWSLPQTNEMSELLAVAASITETEAAQKKPRAVVSKVTVPQIQAYLSKLKEFYDQLKDATVEEVYTRCLEIEAEYVKHPEQVNNAAKLVHRINALDYFEYQGKSGYGSPKTTYGRILPLRNYFRNCPHPECKHPWTVAEQFQIHIENQTLVCPKCLARVNYDMYKIATLVSDIPQFVGNSSTWIGKEVQLVIKNPPVPKDGLMKTFITDLSQTVRSQEVDAKRAAIMNQFQSGIRTKLEMYLNRGIGRFHVDLVRGLYNLWQFVRGIGQRFDYWMQPAVLEAAIVRFHKAMYVLNKFSSKHRFLPTAEIELVWQTLQTSDADEYQKFHRKANGDNDITAYYDDGENWDPVACYAETFLTWQEQFDEVYGSVSPDFYVWSSGSKSGSLKKRFEKYSRVASRNSGFGSQQDDLLAQVVTSAVATKDVDGTNAIPVAAPVSGYVIGSPVPARVSRQQSKQLDRLLDEDGFLCRELFIVNA